MKISELFKGCQVFFEGIKPTGCSENIIYFLTLDGYIQYIGVTKRVRAHRRLAEHFKKKTFGTIYSIPAFDSRAMSEKFESGLITYCNPPLNQKDLYENHLVETSKYWLSLRVNSISLDYLADSILTLEKSRLDIKYSEDFKEFRFLLFTPIAVGLFLASLFYIRLFSGLGVDHGLHIIGLIGIWMLLTLANKAAIISIDSFYGFRSKVIEGLRITKQIRINNRVYRDIKKACL